MKRFLIVIQILLSSTIVSAQSGTMPGLARIAGKGIMVFPGEQIPAVAGTVTGYRIERKAGNEDFREVATLDATKSIEEFRTRVASAQKMLPYPIDLTGYKIDSIWQVGSKKGNLSALGLAGISLPVIAGFNLVWLDENVIEGTTYQYRVVPAGNASAFTSEQIAYSKNVAVDKLHFFEKEYTNKYISMRYVAAINNVPAYAEVYRNENQTGFRKVPAKVLINLKNADTMRYHIIDTNVRYGQIYEYYLRVFDALGNAGENSDTILLGSLSVPKISMPVNLSTVSDTINTAIKISWNLENPELIRSIRLMRSTNSLNGFKQIAILSPNDNIYIDQSAAPMTPYFYYFELTGKLDSLPKKSTVFAGTYEHKGKPFAPVAVTARGTANGNIIRWQYPHQGAAGFYVYRIEGNRPMQLSSLIDATDSVNYSFTDNAALQEHRFYSYMIRAISVSNVMSDNSDTVEAQSLAGNRMSPPSSPLNVSASLNENIVSLFWTDLKEGDESIAGYLVIRKKQGTGKTDTLRTAKNFIADKNVETNSSYVYQVIALNTYGAKGAPSQPVSIMIPGDVVLPPAALRASALKEGIAISWERPEHGEAYSYNVYRYTQGNEPKLVGNAKNAASFTDKTATRGELYFYKVRSANDSKQESEDSEEVGIQYE